MVAPAPILFLMLPPPMLKPSTTATLSPMTVLAPCSALDRRLPLLRVRGQEVTTLMLAHWHSLASPRPDIHCHQPSPRLLPLSVSLLLDNETPVDCFTAQKNLEIFCIHLNTA